MIVQQENEMSRHSMLVIGSANMDMVVKSAHFPRAGETVLGYNFGMYPGGKGANQAVAAAKLGGDVLFIGKMGNDLFKERLVDSMTRDHVNLEHLFTDEDNSTGIALIMVDEKGENEIVVVSGSNMRLTPDDINSKQYLFPQVSVVLTQLEIPMETVETAAHLAKKSNGIFILNPAPAQKLPESLLKAVDYLTPNETELALIAERPVDDMDSVYKAARDVIKRGVRNLIVTLGDKGALWVNEKRQQLFPARKVERVVDTTAAGDAFNGAFALSLAQGRSVDWAIQFANIVAAYSVTKMGAQSSMPLLGDIDDKAEMK